MLPSRHDLMGGRAPKLICMPTEVSQHIYACIPRSPYPTITMQDQTQQQWKLLPAQSTLCAQELGHICHVMAGSTSHLPSGQSSMVIVHDA